MLSLFYNERFTIVINVVNEPSDFYVANMTCYMTSARNQQGMDRFGGALDSAEDAGLMIVGDEFSEIDGYDRYCCCLVVFCS